jgi:hypothetical protein
VDRLRPDFRRQGASRANDEAFSRRHHSHDFYCTLSYFFRVASAQNSVRVNHAENRSSPSNRSLASCGFGCGIELQAVGAGLDEVLHRVDFVSAGMNKALCSRFAHGCAKSPVARKFESVVGALGNQAPAISSNGASVRAGPALRFSEGDAHARALFD